MWEGINTTGALLLRYYEYSVKGNVERLNHGLIEDHKYSEIVSDLKKAKE